MIRPVVLLAAVLALIIGLVGVRTARIQNGAVKTEAITQEIKELRRELDDLKGKLQKQAENYDELAKKFAGIKQRAEESELIAQAQYVRNENLPLKIPANERLVNKLPEAIVLAQPEANLALVSVKGPVRGQIMKIDAADLTLVEVNLGKETGLEKHNTLEVYRPGPQPEYIGTLRIFEVYDRRAFCRLVSTNPLKKQILKVGDQVR